ncbi:MAG: type II secretion system F family protein [Armatimonadetes bacterium]|nr:type II secretion system F family protein [Armatimonadota bacterium]
MPLFRYEATDRQGELRRGAMEASSEEAVRSRLAQMGYNPVTIAAPASAGRSTAAAKAPPVAAQVTMRPFVVSHLSVRDQAYFWRQLAELARAGIGPYDAFRTLGVRSRNKAMKRAALDVAARVQNGTSVADAMAANGDVFGTDFRMAVLAGETGGFVHEVYDDFATSLEAENKHRMRWRWVGWIYKPSIALSIMTAHFVVKFAHYVPSIQSAAGDTDAQWKAHLLVGWNQYLRETLLFTIPLILLVFIGTPLLLEWLERGPLRATADRVVMSLPVVAQLKRVRVMERFFRMLKRLSAAGVPALAAWDAASESVGNYQVAHKLHSGRSALAAGQGFSSALSLSGTASRSDVDMLATADQTGRVPEMLQHLEDDYAARAESIGKIIRIALIVLLIVANGVLSIYIAMAIAGWYAKIINEVLGWAS